jgi:RNA polymerase sigma factor for flagellar operon FliA
MHPYLANNETASERRERLILEHMPQVHFIARRIHERLPGNVALDDLVSTGMIGLISAIDNYDESQGAKLKTYAEYKIRGFILDSLRSMDWASRHRRKKAKDIEAAVHKAEQHLHRAPTEDEIAKEMNLSLPEYQARLVEIQGLNLQSLEAPVGTEQKQPLLSVIPSGDEDLPSTVLERSELERLLAEAIDAMPPMERTVLALYFKEELTLREIASVMDLSISRVADLKTQSIVRLRSRMQRQWPMTRGK